MLTTRVLIVDDTALFRRIISEALSAIPGVEIVGEAPNGRLALARLAELKPDLMTLDIEMPEMSGLEVLDAMRNSGLATSIIILSSQTAPGSQMTIRALESGAFDFITKPEGRSASGSLLELRNALRPRIEALARQRQIHAILRDGFATAKPPVAPPRAVPPLTRPRHRTGHPLVLIGVSTGGPAALAQVLPSLPARIGAPVFIVQHMPAYFTDVLAQRLHSKSAFPVKEAGNGETALIDCAYIAPGGKQMKLAPGNSGEIIIRITDDPPENACRPSVDYLFRSAATHFPGRCVAAVLTGMGSDGTEGMRQLKRTGSINIAQDEASCVVFGMPREAILAGVVDTVVPLGKIAGAIMRGIAEVQA